VQRASVINALIARPVGVVGLDQQVPVPAGHVIDPQFNSALHPVLSAKWPECWLCLIRSIAIIPDRFFESRNKANPVQIILQLG
jgi:hypothetical protein